MMMLLVVHGLRIEGHAEREALGPSGPAGRIAFGRSGPTSREAFGKLVPGDVRSVLRSTLPGPRVRAPGVSLFLCAWRQRSAADIPADRKRPGVITALASDRSAPGLTRQGTDTDPRPCTGAVLLTGNDSRCQPNFVVFAFEPTRYCEANPVRRPQPCRGRGLH